MLFNHSWTHAVHFSWTVHHRQIIPSTNQNVNLVNWFAIEDKDRKWSFYSISDTKDGWLKLQIFTNHNVNNRFSSADELAYNLKLLYDAKSWSTGS